MRKLPDISLPSPAENAPTDPQPKATTLSLLGFAGAEINDYNTVVKNAPADATPAEAADIVVIGYYTWFQLSIIHDALLLSNVALGNIEDNTAAIIAAVNTANIDLQTRMQTESTTLFDFLRNVLAPEIIAGLSTPTPTGPTVIDVLQNFIHPDLAKLNVNTAAGLGELADETRFATITQDQRAFDSMTLLLGRLDELIDASKSAGGLNIDEWVKGVTPHSDPEPTVNVVTSENVTPWIKAPSGLFPFIVDRFGLLLRDIVKAAFGAADSVAPAFKPMIDPVLDLIDDRVKKLGEVTPDRAFSLAREFLADAFNQGLKAHLLSAACEKAGDQVKNLGIQQIGGLVGELGGFQQLSEALWGTALKSGIGRPAEYQVNAITRSRILSERDIVEAFIQRKMDAREMADLLAFHGYGARAIDHLAAHVWRRARLREITLLASDVSVDEDHVIQWLEEAGYEDLDVKTFLPAVMQQSMKAQRQALTSEVMANLRDGLLSDEDAEAQFDRLRYPEEAKRLLLDAGRLGFRRSVITAHISELEAMFQNDQIKEPEFILALQGLGVRNERIEAIVGKAVSKAIGRTTREENAQTDKDVREFQQASLAALKAQFQAQLITAAAFEANLVAIGFLPSVAREIVALESLKLLSKVQHEQASEAEKLIEEIRRARIAAFIELFRDGLIDDKQLRANLLALGLAPELADAVVFREIAKQAEPTQTVKATTTH